MKRIVLAICVTVIAGHVAPFTASTTGAATLTYPALNSNFPACTTADQEFCVESLSFTPDGGATVNIADPATASQTDVNKPYLYAGFFFSAYTGPTTTADGTGLMPTMNANVLNNAESRSTSPIRDGIAAGTYTYRFRTGDYDPTYVVVQGDWVNHVVEKGADGYFTVEVTARPLTFLTVGANVGKCLAGNWKTDCEGDSAIRRWLGGAFVMHQNSATRDISRGTAISTTASYIKPSAPAADGSGIGAKQSLTVAGPHFVPDGFLTSGKTENGRYLNPAVYKMFLPYAATVRSLALANIQTTEEKIKEYLKTSSIFSGTILNEAGVRVQKDLTVTDTGKGVLINFNLDTFSAPNPILYMSNPERSRTNATAGAAISPLRTAKKGQKINRATLLGASPGTKVGATTSRSPKVCAVAGSTVRMLKAGTCNLLVTVSTTVSGKSVSSKVNVAIAVS